MAAGLVPAAWSQEPAPGAVAAADVPVADGQADPVLQNAPLGEVQPHQPGVTLASSSGGSLGSMPSRVLSTGEARMVGLTWSGAAPQAMELRSQNPDGSWTDWTPVDAIDGADEEIQATDPVWIGASRNVEVRAARDGQDAGADLTAVLIDSPTTRSEAALSEAGTNPAAEVTLESGAVLAAGDASVAASLPVPVIRRATWGANESYRSGSPSYATVRAATVHHTASTNNYTKATSAAQVRGFYAYHTRTLGWSDIGYNVLVDKYGQVFEGRAGGLDRGVIGAHAGGFNTGTFGISMIGTYTSATPSAAMTENVAQMIAWKFRISGIKSGWGTVGITSQARNVKYAYGTTANLNRIFGHRDTSYTACPGNAGYAKLPSIRARVTNLLGSAPPVASAPVSVSAVQVPATVKSGETVRLSNGAYRLAMQGDGNLVMYNSAGQATWASMTFQRGSYLAVQGDGNVVIYNASRRPAWYTATFTRTGRLMLQPDGNLVLYSGSATLWDSKGHTRHHAVRV